MDSCLFTSRFLDGRDNAGISTTAADVAAHAFAHRHSRRTTFVQQAGGRHDLSRRTVTALETIVFDEGSLQRMEFIAVREAFDRRDFAALVCGCKCQAGIDAMAVSQYCA